MQSAALREIAGCLVKDRKAARERVAEPGLFEAQGFDDERFGTQKLGVSLTHFPRKAGTSRHIKGSLAPSIWAWRMARRMIRRST